VKLLAATGRMVIDAISGAGESLLLLGRASVWLRALHRTMHQLLRQLDMAGFGSIIVLSMIAAITGMIMVMQTGPTLEEYGAIDQIGGVIGVTFCRELGPLWAAVIVLARVGSAMAAELGTMAVNEEVDALRVMGIEPERYLVMPRIVALVLAMPLLTALADVVGLAGGAGVALSLFGVPFNTFYNGAQALLDWQDFYGGLIKSTFFGAIIGTIACYQGLATREGAVGVGRATTNTVRLSVIFVLIADLILTSYIQMVLHD